MDYWKAKQHHYQIIRAAIKLLQVSLKQLQEKLHDHSKPVDELRRLWNEQKRIMATLEDEYQALRELQGRK